jgi:PAS domain S-box-containing protein
MSMNEELRPAGEKLESSIAQRVTERDFIAGILDTAGVAIYVLDHGGRIMRVNAAFEAVSGYTFAEVAGKTLLETVVPAECAAAFEAYLGALLAGETPQRLEGYWQRKDGSRRWMDSSKHVLLSARGEIDWIIGVAIDRTRWLKAEDELLTERNFIASVLETAAALVVVLDPEGRIVRPNEAFVAAAGYPLEALQGAPLWDLLPGEDVESVKQAFAEVRSGRIPSYRHASYLVRRDGSRRKVEWASTHLLDTARQREFLVVTGIDITEKQRVADELRARAEELAELHRRYMASGLGVVVAHELSQPLTAIASYSEGSLKRLRQGNLSTEDLAHDLEQIEVQAHRAAHVIRRLRDFLGKTGVEAKVEDLNATVSSACELFVPEAYQRDIRIVLDLCQEPVSVLVDRIRTEHVLINLFQNAVEAIRSEGMSTGQIRVQTTVDANGAARVTIRDTGPGVRDQDVERIFERFYTTEAQGIGLGLPISRALVEAQGGRLWAEPSTEGAVFHFTLPLAP